jgi:hypothetical protein
MAILLDLASAIVDDLGQISANGTPVRILDLTSPTRDEITLGAKALPETGVAVTDKLRVHKVANAGSNKATLHLQGMEYDDIVLRGRFRFDALDAVRGLRARKRVLFLQAMQHRKAPCRLIWGQNIIREGVIGSVTIINHRHDEVEYEITFIVSQALERGALVPSLAPTLNQRRMDAALRTVRDGLDAVLTVASVGAVLVRATGAGLFQRQPQRIGREYQQSYTVYQQGPS